MMDEIGPNEYNWPNGWIELHGWTLRMDENWTTLIQLAKWVKWIIWDEPWEWMKIDHISTIGQMCEMNYMDELWDGWKLDHINTIGQMGWNELHGINWEWMKMDHINTIGQMGWNELHGWTLRMDESEPPKWKSTTLGFRV